MFVGPLRSQVVGPLFGLEKQGHLTSYDEDKEILMKTYCIINSNKNAQIFFLLCNFYFIAIKTLTWHLNDTWNETNFSLENKTQHLKKCHRHPCKEKRRLENRWYRFVNQHRVIKWLHWAPNIIAWKDFNDSALLEMWWKMDLQVMHPKITHQTWCKIVPWFECFEADYFSRGSDYVTM